MDSLWVKVGFSGGHRNWNSNCNWIISWNDGMTKKQTSIVQKKVVGTFFPYFRKCFIVLTFLMGMRRARWDERDVLGRIALCMPLADRFVKMGMHCGPDQPRIQTEVLGLLLVRLLVRLHCSLICLFRTTCFARVLCCAHSLARPLCSLPHLWNSEWWDGYFVCVFRHSGPRWNEGISLS